MSVHKLVSLQLNSCVLITMESREKIWRLYGELKPPPQPPPLVALDAVSSRAMVLLLFTHCLIFLILLVGVMCLVLALRL